MVSSRGLRLAELRPYVDKARRMRGWSFDTQTFGLGSARPWDYDERARELMLGAKVMLEMDTGEGERFPRLCDGYPGIALATEDWPPNVPVAATRLAPIGIDVLHASGLHLPLGYASLGLVFNRHEELEPGRGRAGPGPRRPRTHAADRPEPLAGAPRGLPEGHPGAAATSSSAMKTASGTPVSYLGWRVNTT